MNKLYSKKTLTYIFSMLILLVSIFLIFKNTSYANLEETEEMNEKKSFVEVAKSIEKKPQINSKVALVFDRNSKRILYEKNGLKQVPMASTTKIMTAIVVLENSKLTDMVVIPKKAVSIGGSKLGLKVNDKITVNDLLYGLLLKSGNDCAVALAINTAGSVEKFADMMNEKASKLGLNNSHFVTPHGLDNIQHFTTAYELACMADYALQIPKFREIVGTKMCNILINGKSVAIKNTNELLGNLNGVYGVKTGFTNGAGRCLVTSCKRGKLDIITVVLGSDTKKIRSSDSIKLIEYVNKNYSVVNIEEKIKNNFENWKLLNEKRIYINKGKTQNIKLKLGRLPYNFIAVLNQDIDNIDFDITCMWNIEAPIKKDMIVGNMKIRIGNESIGNIDILNDEDIGKKRVVDYLFDFCNLISKENIYIY